MVAAVLLVMLGLFLREEIANLSSQERLSEVFAVSLADHVCAARHESKKTQMRSNKWAHFRPLNLGGCQPKVRVTVSQWSHGERSDYRLAKNSRSDLPWLASVGLPESVPQLSNKLICVYWKTVLTELTPQNMRSLLFFPMKSRNFSFLSESLPLASQPKEWLSDCLECWFSAIPEKNTNSDTYSRTNLNHYQTA